MMQLLLLGYRSPAIQAAQKLGYEVIVWTHEALTSKQRATLHEAIIAPFPNVEEKISPEIIQALSHYTFAAIIATTESSVLTAARLQDYFGLEHDATTRALPCFDKYHMKQKIKQAGIPLADFELISKNTTAHDLIARWNFPIAIKPRCSSGSRGLVIAHDEVTLTNALQNNYLAEQFIHGVEFSMESFIQNGTIIFHNITEYHSRQSVSIIPFSLPSADQVQLQEFNAKVIKAMQIKNGITHMEVYFTKQGLVFGEIAIRPPGGYLMELMSSSYDFDSWETYLKIALKIPCQLPQHAKKFSAAWIFHPEVGKVSEISGIEEIEKIPHVQRVYCKLKVGSQVPPRLGSGISSGQVVFCSDDRKSLVTSLEAAQELLKIKIIA